MRQMRLMAFLKLKGLAGMGRTKSQSAQIIGRFRTTLAVSVILLGLLSACVQVEYGVTLKPDGSGVHVTKFVTAPMFAADLKNTILRDRKFANLEQRGGRIEERLEGGVYEIKVTLPFTKVEELNDADVTHRFERSGTFLVTYVYSQSWKPGKADASEIAMLRSMPFVATINMPAHVATSNAQKVTADRATWNLTLADLKSGQTFTVQSSQMNAVPLVLGLAILGGAVGGAAFLFSRRKGAVGPTWTTEPELGQASKGKAMCNHCGKQNGVGSKFCIECGTKLA